MSNHQRSPSQESFTSVKSIESVRSIDSMTFPIDNIKRIDSAGDSGEERFSGLTDVASSTTIDKDGNPQPAVCLREEAPNSSKDDASSSVDQSEASHTSDDKERAAAAAPSSHKKHPRFYLDSQIVDFVLDDGTLYRLFRQSLAAHSSTFATKYLFDCAGDKPVKLPGVSSVDFDRFLALFYPSEPATCELTQPAEWTSVLRLAHLWEFPALRARAIQELARTGSAVDRIAAAREFAGLGELQIWLLPAFREACTERGWLDLVTVADAERLGAGTILAVARIREGVRGAAGAEGVAGGSVGRVERAIVEAGLAPDAGSHVAEKCGRAGGEHGAAKEAPATVDPLLVPETGVTNAGEPRVLDEPAHGGPKPIKTGSIHPSDPVKLKPAPKAASQPVPASETKTGDQAPSSTAVAAATREKDPATDNPVLAAAERAKEKKSSKRARAAEKVQASGQSPTPSPTQVGRPVDGGSRSATEVSTSIEPEAAAPQAKARDWPSISSSSGAIPASSGKGRSFVDLSLWLKPELASRGSRSPAPAVSTSAAGPTGSERPTQMQEGLSATAKRAQQSSRGQHT